MPKTPANNSGRGSDLDSLATSKGKSLSSRQARARFAPEYEALLQKLITARKSVGMTQENMARALGKTQSHVSMCENRERELSIIDLWKWCLALDMTWSDFVRELENEVTPSNSSPHK
jgi:DNA-binding XRE family transcriptional regulator